MIILPEHGIVIITPPKCGSTSIHTFFQSRGGIWCIGPQGPFGNDVDKHTTFIPYQFKDYQQGVVIRNPRHRFLSLYRHYCRFVIDESFPRYVTAYEMELLGWFYSQTITDMVKHLTEYSVIDIADFDKWLPALGYKDKLPKLHTATNKLPGGDLLVPESWISNDYIRQAPAR